MPYMNCMYTQLDEAAFCCPKDNAVWAEVSGYTRVTLVSLLDHLQNCAWVAVNVISIQSEYVRTRITDVTSSRSEPIRPWVRDNENTMLDLTGIGEQSSVLVGRDQVTMHRWISCGQPVILYALALTTWVSEIYIAQSSSDQTHLWFKRSTSACKLITENWPCHNHCFVIVQESSEMVVI